MKLNQLREFVKQVVREEQDYQQLFKHMLDKSGKSIPSMSDDEKKKFFNAVDTAYKAKSEGRLTGYNESVNELMTYSARSKETGKVVMFKDKAHRDAAIKRGTFTPAENTPKKQSPVSKTKGASVFEAELTAGQKKIDVDGDGEIEGSDLAKLRANKDESINEANIDIKVGDMVKVDNPHWEAALGKKGPFKRKVKMIDHDNVFFTDGSNSSTKYIKR